MQFFHPKQIFVCGPSVCACVGVGNSTRVRPGDYDNDDTPSG